MTGVVEMPVQTPAAVEAPKPVPQVRGVLPGDVDYLAPILREIDQRECQELGGRSGEEALRIGSSYADARTIVSSAGLPVGMFGVTPGPTFGWGVPWLLASNALFDDPETCHAFVKGSPLWVFWMHSKYPLLANVIHRDNRESIRWLGWLGFEFKDDPDYADALIFRSVRDV